MKPQLGLLWRGTETFHFDAQRDIETRQFP
jgi:hypothetical protein